MRKFLIIDDSEDILSLMSAMLKNLFQGSDVYTALSGKQGLYIADEFQPDVILLDIVLPDIDGFEVCEKLKGSDKTRNIPIIMLTALRGDSASRIKGLEIGADVFLTKPVEEPELKAQIGVMLKIKDTEDKLREEKEQLEKIVMQRTGELEESRERYRNLFENLSSGVAVYKAVDEGMDFRVVDFNIGGCAIDNVKKEDVIGKLCSEAFPGIKDFGLLDVLYRVWKSGKPEYFPVSFYKDYRVAGWRDNYVYKLPSGEIVAVYDDMTEQRQAQDELIKSQFRLAMALDANKAGIFEYNIPIGDDLYYSRRCAEILGYTKDEILDSSTFARWIRDRIHHDDLPMLDTSYTLFLSGDLPVLDLEIRMKHKSGKWVWVHIVSKAVVLSDSGRVSHVIGMMRDISTRKKIEGFIKKQLELGMELSSISDLGEAMELILKSAVQVEGMDCGGIHLIDSETRNIELLASSGLSDEFIKLASFYNKSHPNAKIVMGGYPVYFSTSGNNLPVNDIIVKEGLKALAIVPVRHKGEVIACLNVASHANREISNSTKYELESISSQVGSIIARIGAEEKIRESLQEKEILLKEIHHRVKNNMQIISSLLRLQAFNVKDIRLEELLQESHDRIRSMALIHEKMYTSETFSRVNISEYIKSLISELISTYMDRSFRFEVKYVLEDIILSIDKAIPCGLIINELITNAIKHAFPGGAKGIITVETKCNEYNTMIISDNGIGMSAEINIKNTKTMGLSLVNSLVRQLNGEIQVIIEKGTRFNITFPRL